jgi:hypothetical protein
MRLKTQNTGKIFKPFKNNTKQHNLQYSRTPLIQTLVIPINYPDRLGPPGKFVQNSTKLICLEIAGYRIKYSTVLWLLELHIRRRRKV